MSTFPECDHLTPHRKAICRNETGLPIVGPHGVNAYRQSWGVGPLDSNTAVPAVGVRAPNYIHRPPAIQSISPTVDFGPTRWVGTNLARLLKRYTVSTGEGCQPCQEWINLLNQWGPSGCREHFEAIRDRLMRQDAMLQDKKGFFKGIFDHVKIGVTMLADGQWPTITSLIETAIRQAEEQA